MQKTNMWSALLICIGLTSSMGCATSKTATDNGVTVRGVPIARTLAGAVVTFAPHCDVDTCRGMYLVVENRIATPLEIDWPRTLFFINGNPSGSFLGDGNSVERTSLTKLAPTVVEGGQTFQAILSPIKMSSFEEESGWVTRELPVGRIGARVVIKRQGIPYTTNVEYEIAERAPQAKKYYSQLR